MSDEAARDSFTHVSDVTLYHLMSEAGTRLRGRLIALERAADASGDQAAEQRWREQRIAVARARDAIGARDRAAQVEAILTWEAERDGLPKPPDPVLGDMGDQTARAALARLGDVPLYDLMCETATVLGGHLVALERAAVTAGDDAGARRWRDQHYAVADACDAVDPTDRDAQIDAILTWRTEHETLPVPRPSTNP